MDKDKIISGNFYFLEDRYFHDFPDSQLMSNKETINGVEHNRPCFFAIEDTSTNINWFIPISSQVGKFQTIYNKKILKYKKVDTIVFGYVMGNKKAFLIQNMFPATPEYVRNDDNITILPVSITEKLKIELTVKARRVLGQQRRGVALIFPDVLKIESELIAKQTLITAITEVADADQEEQEKIHKETT